MGKNNISILQAVKDVINDFRRVLKKYLLFEGIYKLITSFVLIPFLIYILHVFIGFIGLKALINTEILNYGLRNFKGLLGVTIVSIIALIIVFIEQGVLIVISEKSYFKKEINIIDALVTTFYRIPEIIGFGTIKIIFFMFCIIPFGSFGINASLIKNIQLPKFIVDEIYKSTGLTILYILLTIILYLVFIKWIFVFHCIIIEKLNVTKAIKKSNKLSKNSFVKIAFTVIVWNLFLLVAFIAILGVAVCILIIIGILFKHFISTEVIRRYLTAFTGVALFVFSILSTPLNITLITKLYYAQRLKLEGILEDEIQDNKRSSIRFKFNRKYTILTIICVFFATVIFISHYSSQYISEVFFNNRKVKIIAHRGNCDDAPENSLSAIKNSINKHKADYAEIDVQETKDGIVVLMHDKNLRRLTGVDKNVKELTFNEIMNLDIGLNFLPQYKGEKIPTLDETIRICKGKIKLLIELKPYGNGEELSKKVVDIIEKNNAVNDCIIHSLDYDSLKNVKRFNTKIKTGYIVYAAVGDITSLNADFYTVEQSMVTEKLVKAIHNRNKEIYVWTVNDKEDMKNMIDLNVDSIITDEPSLLYDVIKGIK